MSEIRATLSIDGYLDTALQSFNGRSGGAQHLYESELCTESLCLSGFRREVRKFDDFDDMSSVLSGDY